jgi:hypothetical protein
LIEQGPVADVNGHFATHGFAVPQNFNPADHIMNVVQLNDITDLEQKQVRNCNLNVPLVVFFFF